jgi:hypothetical protein
MVLLKILNQRERKKAGIKLPAAKPAPTKGTPN